MPKQSATNPRFRCNECKEYHLASVPSKKMYYQCAIHGIFCSKHFTSSRYKAIPYLRSPIGRDKPDVEIDKKHYGKCGCHNNVKDPYFKKYGLYSNSNTIPKIVCLKKVIRFNWHKDMNRWIEEGREEEEKAKAKPKVKSKTKPDYLKEINVLLDLLEDDTLTKEVFIKKMREKIK